MIVPLSYKLVKVTCACGCTYGVTKNEIKGDQTICPSCNSRVSVFRPYEFFLISARKAETEVESS